MPQDRFLIAPYDKGSGLQTDFEPFAIPDQAFAQLNNAYVYRGRIRKRVGSRWLDNDHLKTRLRVQVGTYGAPGVVPANVTGAIGQMFSIGTVEFTVNVLGNPANLLVAYGSAVAATFDTTTLAFAFAGVLDASGNPPAAGEPIWFYPALPVMGILTKESSAVNLETYIAFDTLFSYGYNNGWFRIAGETVAGDASWTGSNSEFFWGTTYGAANAFDYNLYVTNYNESEPRFMRYLDTTSTTWTSFRPQIANNPPSAINIYLDSARILVTFKNRLLAFNTWETETATQRNYPFRVRWSAIGDPTAVTAWRQDIPGKGSGLDLPSHETIVTVQFIKDRLIVFAETSTWELVYNGNAVNPFQFQQINTELGAESTFSIVPFDKVAIGVGNVGIMACNGANVERIDSDIPQLVFSIHNVDSGVERVYGIRDYYTEMVYWTFPSPDATANFPYPNRMLVYNYLTGTWALNQDSITAFGYFQTTALTAGISWDSQIITWDQDYTWDGGATTARFRNVIAGNQEGWTFIMDPDIPVNAAVLQLTDITIGALNVVTISCIDHNLRSGDYILITGVDGTLDMPLLNNKIYEVVPDAMGVVGPNSFTIVYEDAADTILNPASVYQGGGRAARVTNPDIWTKQYNFYAKQGRNAAVNKVDFLVDRTANGEVVVDYYVSTNSLSMVDESHPIPLGTGAIVGTNVLETSAYTTVPFEATASQLWHCVYFQADGEYVQFRIYMNDEQTRDVTVDDDGNITGPSFEPYQMHQIIIHAMPTSSRLQ